MDKTTLDEIIDKNKAQPVGHGYIDIIVSRVNYKDFIWDLVRNGYKIDSISWWEWCSDGKENRYGLGGPKSYFYDGWFSELSIDSDDTKSGVLDSDNRVREILDKIETKTIHFSDEMISFTNNNWLTPAVWLNVPDDWRNKYCA